MHKVRITLQDITPSIWRIILVEDAITLHKFNHMIQAAMGWTNCHLHEFEIAGQRYGIPSDEYFDENIKDGKKYILSNMLKKGDTCLYTYDFGDSWCHTIEVEDVAASFGRLKAPACIGGARCCPPEDCGGVYGYVDLMENLADPEHEEYNSTLDWLEAIGFEEGYDPEAFTKEAATKRMRSKLWQNMEY